MRLRHSTMLFVLALAGCGEADPLCNSPEFVGHLAQLERSVGSKFADQYFTFFRRPWGSCSAKKMRGGYIEEFFYGFRTPYAYSLDPIPRELRHLEDGMHAGQKYRLEHPVAVAEVWASFGYSPVSISGKWKTSLDTSTFYPNEPYQGEVWHLEQLYRATIKDVRKTEWGDSQEVEIRGYVSGLKDAIYSRPEYDRNLFVQVLKGAGGA